MAETLIMSEFTKFNASEVGCIPSLDRMNSCLVPATTSSLLWALEKDNLQLFSEQLMDLDLQQINEELLDYGHSTILHLVAKSGKVDFMNELMARRDVNPNIPHRNEKRFPIHIAAEKGDIDMIKLLLNCGSDVNARMENGDTILHVLAKRSALKWIKTEEEKRNLSKIHENFVKSVKLVLSTHCEYTSRVNIDCENKIGFTPIYFAVTNGSEEVAKLLLNDGACITTETDDGDTVEDLINQRMPNITQNIDERNKENKDTIENKLFQLLYFESYEPGKFLEEWEKAESNNNKVHVDADNGSYTFLQFCCDQGHEKLVIFLLERGADPNMFCDNYRIPPVVLAAHHGYYKVLQIFKQWTMEKKKGSVDFCALHQNKEENVLHKILKGESKAHQNVNFRDYNKCLTIVLDDHATFHRIVLPAINAQDQLGNTPLHIAAQTGNTSAIRKLLKSEANIGLKNFQEEVPIAHIPPLVMMEFLDDCVQGNNIPSDNEFKITFNYSFLGPPLKDALEKTLSSESPLMIDEIHENSEKPSPQSFNDLPEAEPLWYIAQLPDHRPLLTHPVITSFLCMKWRRIRPFYYINLLFYLLFVVCITAYLVQLNVDLQNPELKDTAAQQTGKDENTAPENKNNWTDRISKSTLVLMHINIILLLLLTLREVFQAFVSFRRYVFGSGYINLENFLELAMISISWYLVFGGDLIIKDYEINGRATRSLSATVILFAWYEMVQMLGRHPKMSIYVTMLSTVAWNFFRFLTWFGPIILSFGLAFFVILSREKPKGEEEEAKNEYFEKPSKAILKTIVMSLTGEIEFEGIDFADNVYYQIIFLIWVFCVMLVLMNLLNGLAVSDIAMIQTEAEILSYVSRVESIAFIESMLLGDPFQFLTNWPRYKWSKYLPACACYHGLNRKQFCINSCFNRLIGNTLLFTDRLMNKKAVFYPNQSKKERGGLPGPTGSNEKKGKLVMDANILENAKALIIKKQEKDSIEELKNEVMQMKKVLSHLSHLVEKFNG